MGDAELTVAGVRMVEMPFLALVDGLVAAAAGGFATVDERCDGGAAALVVVTPAASAGCAGWLASAARAPVHGDGMRIDPRLVGVATRRQS